MTLCQRERECVCVCVCVCERERERESERSTSGSCCKFKLATLIGATGAVLQLGLVYSLELNEWRCG